jgi:hypothetical protein
MLAPERFAQWLTEHEHMDQELGHVYRYHPRSDAHSIALCEKILVDLLATCSDLRAQAARGEVAYGVNLLHTWPNGKKKTIDLAIGTPIATPLIAATEFGMVKVVTNRNQKTNSLREVFFSLEAKAVMTEHSKQQPRVYDELSSSHEIVHQGSQRAIAAGITVVNIAPTFVAPLRQRPGMTTLKITLHTQPAAAMGMIQHLRGLPIREHIGQVGFDAYATFVVECDNQGPARLHSTPPAPQLGERDRYETFLERITRQYAERFGSPHP